MIWSSFKVNWFKWTEILFNYFKRKLIMIIFYSLYWTQIIFSKGSIVLWRLKVWIVYICKCEIWNFIIFYNFLVDSKNLSIFKKLETLSLSHNKFKNTSLQQLNIFTSLKNLSLRLNYDGGFFPIQGMCNYYYYF